MRTLEDFDQVKAPEIRGFLLTFAQKFKMKAIHLVLFSLLAVAATAQTDTVLIGTTGAHYRFDNVTIPCLQSVCPVDSCHWFALRDSGNIRIAFSDFTSAIQVSIVKDGQSLLTHGCESITPPWSSIEIAYSMPSQISFVVCGAASDSLFVQAFLESSPLQTLPQPILRLDTLCPMTGISDGQTIRAYNYYDAVTLQLVTELQPNTAYLKRKKL